MEHCKKLTSWDKYGVRKFPYPGRRKYTPDVNRSFYGIITITNDVFGLTIFQFEREFKACLERRKQHEQRIQNIRYPYKSTNEYLEYLKYGDDTVEDQTLSEVDHTYGNIIQVAGTELEIRTRQRMFIILDKIKTIIMKGNFELEGFTHISSGSLAEGIDLEGSDIDQMRTVREVTVINHLKYLNKSGRKTTFLMEEDERYPGFCKLKLLALGIIEKKGISGSFKESNFGIYLSADKFVNHIFESNANVIRHGPCLSDCDQNIDTAFCIKSNFWPTSSYDWICKHRMGEWPTENVIDDIVKEGCLFVPIGPKNIQTEESELFWRVSFSLAEKRLSHSMNYTQLLCYIVLKLTLKNIINRNDKVQDLLCSYFLKTTLYWVSEEISIDTFRITNLPNCFVLCIDKLISFVSNCYCPNYFIPKHNMFIGKVDKTNNGLLIYILRELRNTEFRLIIGKIFKYSKFIGCRNDIENLSVNLDFLFYRVCIIESVKCVGILYRSLLYIKSRMKSESSEFILDVLKFYHARLHQQVPQLMDLPTHRRKEGCTCICKYNVFRHCYIHLHNGMKSGSISCWLIYASYFYQLGKYTKTLQIVDKVLSRCTPDMIQLEKPTYTSNEINRYKHKTETTSTLNDRMRQGVADNVFYTENSSFIPHELYYMVEDGELSVPPVVMCYCLKFLCYQHLCDVNRKHRALRDLCLSIQETCFITEQVISVNEQLLETALDILCECCKISDDRDTTYCCSIHCTHDLCQYARQTLKKILSHIE